MKTELSEMGDVLTVADVAMVLRSHPSRVRCLVKMGELIPLPMGCRILKFSKQEIVNFLTRTSHLQYPAVEVTRPFIQAGGMRRGGPKTPDYVEYRGHLSGLGGGK